MKYGALENSPLSDRRDVQEKQTRATRGVFISMLKGGNEYKRRVYTHHKVRRSTIQRANPQ